LILDGFFTIFFVWEFVMKLIALKLSYFKSNWNRFDFALVWIGVFGLVMSIALRGEKQNKSGKIIRVARVLRTLRFFAHLPPPSCEDEC